MGNKKETKETTVVMEKMAAAETAKEITEKHKKFYDVTSVQRGYLRVIPF